MTGKTLDRKTIADETLEFLIGIRDSNEQSMGARLKAAEAILRLCQGDLTVNLNWSEQLLQEIRDADDEVTDADDATTERVLAGAKP